MIELNSVVTQILQVSPIMKIVRVKPVGWEFPEFKGGQFVALALPGSAERCDSATDEFETPEDPDKLIKRAYSIASTSTADYVEFYITLVHSGALTPRLFNLNIGDKVFMGKKGVGMFTLDSVVPEKNIVLIATGTGVAPYMSMLRSDALKRKGNIMVVHGAANSWDLGYSSELQLLESMFDQFTYLPTITEPQKEPAGWGGDTRFIEKIWEGGVAKEKWGFDPTADDTEIFLCGNPRMIESMVALLEKDGFTEHTKKVPGQIHVEEF
ncbi:MULTISPECIES: ferredoxin--NADP reductase [unclassified Lentimicrobium]|uniref:ferredoxin--NADP reductase n=1 Tax=unclassified Lentimicrobium TaxID=2677434 RepID=UPI00155509CA|nr:MULTISPECIES: ferredoxin--NADP reductase [unclassified Lentimicrobium]NPD45841.1 ferredoxin--NADP reductase [Lentimicrobium sp. S6]NPD85794.1 ferredoxin--NADP reductase [Lentimicrobium sp. L6]